MEYVLTFCVTSGPFFVFPACESSGKRRKTKAQIANVTTAAIFMILRARKVIQFSETPLRLNYGNDGKVAVMLCAGKNRKFGSKADTSYSVILMILTVVITSIFYYLKQLRK